MSSIEAKEAYLANLQRRVEKLDFGGLPDWQVDALKDCDDVLPDEYCDLLKIPAGSTVARSLRSMEHFVDLPCRYFSGKAGAK